MKQIISSLILIFMIVSVARTQPPPPIMDNMMDQLRQSRQYSNGWQSYGQPRPYQIPQSSVPATGGVILVTPPPRVIVPNQPKTVIQSPQRQNPLRTVPANSQTPLPAPMKGRPSYANPSKKSNVDETYQTADYVGYAEEDGLYEESQSEFFSVKWPPPFMVQLEKALKANKNLKIVVRGNLRFCDKPGLQLLQHSKIVSADQRYTLLNPVVVSVTEEPMFLLPPPKPKKEVAKTDQSQDEKKSDDKPDEPTIIKFKGISLIDPDGMPKGYISTQRGVLLLDSPWSIGMQTILYRIHRFYNKGAEIDAEGYSLRRTDPSNGLQIIRLTAIHSVVPKSVDDSPQVKKLGAGRTPIVENYLQALELIGQQVILEGKLVYDERSPDSGSILLQHYREQRPIQILGGLEKIILDYNLPTGHAVRFSGTILDHGTLILNNPKFITVL